MDTTKILITSDAGTGVNTDLTARYTGCNTWVTDMTNVWTNYYSVKIGKITPMDTRVTTANSDYTTATTGYKDRLTAATPSFNTIATNL